MSITTAKQLAIDYMRQGKNNNLPSLTIAKHLHKNLPSFFKTVEHARNTIRSIRGLKGNDYKFGRAVPDLQKESFWQSAIPLSDTVKSLPYNVQFSGSGLVICDTHIPYHEREETITALNYAEAHGATDWVIVLGDLMDCYMESKFEKVPDMRDFNGERIMTVEFLSNLKKRFKHVVVKEGNHEYRHRRMLLQKAPEWYGVEELTMENLLKAKDIGFDYIAGKGAIHIGDHLTMYHGHEFAVSGVVDPARGAYNRLKSCAIIGHCHRTSQHSQVHHNSARDNISCWSIGCLSELKPDYQPINNYNNGFMIMSISKSKKWVIDGNYRIIKGEVFGS